MGKNSGAQNESKKARPKFDPKKNQKIIDLYDQWGKGEIGRNDVFSVIWDILKPQVMKSIKTNSRTLNADYEDLMQEASVAILEHMKDYDPERGLPGTFFLNWINDSHRNLCRGQKSVYYLQEIKKLSAVAQDAGFDGISDPRLSNVVLSTLSGESMQVVANARKMADSYTPVSYEDAEDTIEDPYHQSPEAVFIQDDRREKGMSIFHSVLNTLEQDIYKAHVCDGMSFKGISNFLKDNDRYCKLGFKKAPTPADIQRMFAVCDRKLANDRCVAAERRENKEKIYKQAPDESIIRFMDSDDFNLDDFDFSDAS